MMIELSRLEIFVFAAESLSFSEAAKHLNLTQPTISHHIQMLEHELGVMLFERSSSGLHLTEAGQFLLPWARKLIRESIEMQEMVAAMQNKIVGYLRIACSTTTGKYLLPQLAARFHNQYLGVRITILACIQENVIPRLLEEEANLGVLSREVSEEGFECQEFFEDHIILIAPASHPWAGGQEIEPADLLHVPFIIREATSGTRQVMLAELAKHDISVDDLDVFLEVGNAEAIVETVAAGFGVSFVSRLATACALEYGKVGEVPVADLDLRRKIYMVRREIENRYRAQDAFWGFIHDPSNADLLRKAEM
ncbi:MAG: selenium metabolism-associated LysR family transcriptional regulator [Anaerolineales bacterium]|jgi:DNA-binding transcriptional LysR family regulator